MSLLTIIQDTTDRLGIIRPSSVVGSSDPQVRQLLALANQEGKELARRHNWTALINEKTFTATLAAAQTSAIPTDYDRMIAGSFWNRTTSWQVRGPVSAQLWQRLQTGLTTLADQAFRIRGGTLYITPTPTAADSMAYEYVSTYWCSNSDGSTERVAWAADDDVGLLNEELMGLGVVWRFLRAKGFDYSEAFRTYEEQFVRLAAEDGVMEALSMGGYAETGVYDPSLAESSWSIT
jgi:hypothetical protein